MAAEARGRVAEAHLRGSSRGSDDRNSYKVFVTLLEVSGRVVWCGFRMSGSEGLYRNSVVFSGKFEVTAFRTKAVDPVQNKAFLETPSFLHKDLTNPKPM